MATPTSLSVTPFLVPGTSVVALVIPNPIEPTTCISLNAAASGKEVGTSTLSGE